MMKIILAISIFLSNWEDLYSQTSFDVVGKWVVFEMISDRIYKNFDNDSIHFFEKEDQLKYQSAEVKRNMSEALNRFRELSIIFNRDSSFCFNFMGDLEKGSIILYPHALN